MSGMACRYHKFKVNELNILQVVLSEKNATYTPFISLPKRQSMHVYLRAISPSLSELQLKLCNMNKNISKSFLFVCCYKQLV